MKPRSRLCWLAAIALLLASVAAAQTSPAPPPQGWWSAYEQLPKIFDAQKVLSGLSTRLQYFTAAFTVLAVGAVIIASVRRVARARSGEESMGWVAGVVMTAALMATGPRIGNMMYSAVDDMAQQSGYSNTDTIQTAWTALRALLPNSSPSMDVLATKAQEQNASEDPTKQDAAWTKKAWEWMKRAWGAMKSAGSTMLSGLRGVVNDIAVFVILLVPALTLLMSTVSLAAGSFLRELLHQLMDVMLPMMIGFTAFAPMRTQAANYLFRYVAVALWPLAWALANAIAVQLLTTTMDWAIQSSRDVITAASNLTGPVVTPAAGIIATAAPLMSWGLLLSVAFMVFFSSFILNAAAVMAPIALTKTLTRGACFAQAQVQQAIASFSAAATTAAGVATGGTSLAAAPAAAGVAKTVSSSMAGIASQTSGGISAVASRLGTASAEGGPVGRLAGIGASVLGKTAEAVGSMASDAEESPPEADSAKRFSPRVPSMADASRVLGRAAGGMSMPRPPKMTAVMRN